MPTRVALMLMVLCAVAMPANGADVTALDQQLLVMIPTPPAHFRPDSGYAGDYQNAPGHAARRRIARQLAREHDALLLDDWPMPALNVDCYVLQAASRTARDRLLNALEGDPRIAWAQPMQQFQVLGAADPLYSLQPAAVRWHLRELHGLANGRSVAVAQIDTGVDLSHPDLRGQIAQARNFVDAGPFVAEPHGTQVAGIIIAREDNGIGIAGIAPRARLLALRACWQQRDGDVCSSFTLAQALQFALQSKVQVVNLSLGGPPDRLLQALLDVALERGTTVVAAVDRACGRWRLPRLASWRAGGGRQRNRRSGGSLHRGAGPGHPHDHRGGGLGHGVGLVLCRRAGDRPGGAAAGVVAAPEWRRTA